MQDKGSFTIVLSGGSLLKALTHLAGKPGMDFSKWYVAYADERNVPHSHEDSNHKGATDAFLSRVSSIRNSFHLSSCIACPMTSQGSNHHLLPLLPYLFVKLLVIASFQWNRLKVVCGLSLRCLADTSELRIYNLDQEGLV